MHVRKKKWRLWNRWKVDRLRVSNNNFLKYELHQFLRELIRINFYFVHIKT